MNLHAFSIEQPQNPAQLLYAVGGAAAAGYAISSVKIIPYLFYPFLMALSAIFFILFVGGKKKV